MGVLVTGGAGYIGSVTVELFREQGEEVVVLEDLSRGYRAAVPPDVPFYICEIGDRELVQHIARDHNIDACIHFAAFAYVGEYVTDPALYFANNVAQGIAFLDALRGAGVNRLVVSSTCATYGEPRALPIEETNPQQPTNPYGWSKLFM